MAKRILAVALILVMTLAIAACGGGNGGGEEGKAWADKLIGKWIIGNYYTEGFEDGLVFNEDGTCSFGGKDYTWEFDKEGHGGGYGAFMIEEDKEEVMAAELYVQDGGYTTLQLANVEVDGGATIKTFMNGMYFRESDYTKVEINSSNWQDYFEFKMSEMKINEDAFGDVSDAYVEQIFVLKDEYGMGIADLSKVGVEMSYENKNYKFTVDHANKTYTRGEEVSTTGTGTSTLSLSNIPVGNDEFGFATFAGSIHFGKDTECVVSDNTNRQITRIEGTVYCFKG